MEPTIAAKEEEEEEEDDRKSDKRDEEFIRGDTSTNRYKAVTLEFE